MVRRKVARSSTIQEPFSVQYRGPSPDSKSGLIMGNLLGSEVSLNHSCVPKCSVQYPTLPFWQENFPSGADNGRVPRFRAYSGLGSDGKKTGNLGRFPNELWARAEACFRFEIWADYGRFLLVVGHFLQASNEAFGRTASVLEEKRRAFRVFPGKSGLIPEFGLCDSYVDCNR